MMKKENRVWGYIIGFFLIYILKVLWDYWWWNEVHFCLENRVCFITSIVSHVLPVTPGEVLIMGLLVWLVFWFVGKDKIK